jgi:UDP-N-acetyl-D-glucosamine dehydrogenase
MEVSVVGLGYVGLPVAIISAKKGHKVIGIDLNKERVEKINQGVSPMEDEYVRLNLKKGLFKASFDYSDIKNSEVIIICVPTPVKENHQTDLSYVEKASESIAKNIKKGALVILESTVYPGTTEEVILPILLKNGLKRTDFFLSHCPERIDPGAKAWPVEKIPRVVGGIDGESTEKTKKFYESIIDAPITPVKGSKEAEATKIMENTFRDINIAFVNEMAKSFDKAGIDIKEVIRGASTKPFAFVPHYPGCGVGGHCIAVDPYYLINKAKEYDFDHEFLRLARKINESMPDYTIELLETELKKLNKTIKGAKVGLLGLAYKANIDDVRESPSLEILKILKEKGAKVTTFDPFVKTDASSLKEILSTVDYVILATAHTAFKEMHQEDLKNIKIIIDGRNFLDKSKLPKNIRYKGIGV